MISTWNSICECNIMGGGKKVHVANTKKKGISTAVFQEDNEPRWQSLSFWLGRVFMWVLTSTAVRWCVSRQEVHSVCLQHDLLKGVSKTPTYLLPQLGMLTRWMMNGDESNCDSSHLFLSNVSLVVDKVLYEQRKGFVLGEGQ